MSETSTFRHEEAYAEIPNPRRKELGMLVEKYHKEATDGKISIQDMCAKMHPHCESISEALFIGAFSDFMLSDNRDVRIEGIKRKIASAVVSGALSEILDKISEEIAKEEAAETKEETPQS